MTARRPSANRVWTNGHILSSAIPTWAHALGADRYETALIGRMHFVGADQRHGFERRPMGELLERLYADWDPGFVARESEVLARDMRVLSAWGKAVQPRHEETLPVPDVEDIEFR